MLKELLIDAYNGKATTDEVIIEVERLCEVTGNFNYKSYRLVTKKIKSDVDDFLSTIDGNFEKMQNEHCNEQFSRMMAGRINIAEFVESVRIA